MIDDQNPALISTPSPAPEPVSTVIPEPVAQEKLRAFEDEHIGKDAVRIRGNIERGYGSKFKDMPPEKHAEYAALERLVEAEQKVIEANAALSTAQVAHQQALDNLDIATKATDEKAAAVQDVPVIGDPIQPVGGLEDLPLTEPVQPVQPVTPVLPMFPAHQPEQIEPVHTSGL